MKIRKNLDLYDPQAYLSILRAISDVVKVGFWFRRRWKTTDEWTRWITRVISTGILSGLPALAVGILGVVLLLKARVPMTDQYGMTTGEYVFLSLGAALLLFVTAPKLNRWAGNYVDLEVPTYVCVRNRCCGNLSYHEIEKVGRICPHCKGEVRLLSPAEKRRWPRWGS
jgi:hypothetical protein